MINNFRNEQLAYARNTAKHINIHAARDYLLFCMWSIEAVDFLYPIN